MATKTKAFLFNFICFGLIFVTLRLGVMNYFFPEASPAVGAIASGIIAIFISPRFAAIPTDTGEKLFMKWIFVKGIKKIGK